MTPTINTVKILKPHPRKGTETRTRAGFHRTRGILKPHPRKGTETRTFCGIHRQTVHILKPHPRKGTETHSRAFHKARSDTPILKPHPRKGTETIQPPHEPCRQSHFKTTSPQGDGNCLHRKWLPLPLHTHFKTTSPQGDGNHFRPLCFFSHSPRFQNHIPARGRKLHTNDDCCAHCC